MKTKNLAIFLALLCLPVFSFSQQIHGTPSGLPPTTIPLATGVNVGQVYTVSNGASATDCTTGGGTTAVVCLWNGSSWTALGSGGGTGFPITTTVHVQSGGNLTVDSGGIISLGTGPWKLNPAAALTQAPLSLYSEAAVQASPNNVPGELLTVGDDTTSRVAGFEADVPSFKTAATHGGGFITYGTTAAYDAGDVIFYGFGDTLTSLLSSQLITFNIGADIAGSEVARIVPGGFGLNTTAANNSGLNVLATSSTAGAATFTNYNGTSTDDLINLKTGAGGSQYATTAFFDHTNTKQGALGWNDTTSQMFYYMAGNPFVFVGSGNTYATALEVNGANDNVGILTAGLASASATPACFTTGIITALSVFSNCSTWSVASGGTGLTTQTSNVIYKGNGASAEAVSSITDNGTTVTTTDTGGYVGPSLTATGANAGFTDFTQGSAQTATASSVGFQAPTSVTSAYHITLPGAPAAGFVSRTNATPSVESIVADWRTSYINQITSVVTLGTNSYTPSANTFPAVTTVAAGTWLVTASLSLQTTSVTAATNVTCQLYDGTAVFAQGYDSTPTLGTATVQDFQMPLVGVITEAGAVTFTARCTSATASQLMEAAAGANSGGNYSSTITAVRIQ